LKGLYDVVRLLGLSLLGFGHFKAFSPVAEHLLMGATPGHVPDSAAVVIPL